MGLMGLCVFDTWLFYFVIFFAKRIHIKMKKTIILGLFVLLSNFVCNAQVDAEKECSETSKRYMSSVKEQTNISKISVESVQSRVIVEADTYENARFTALSKALDTYIEAKSQEDTRISNDGSQFRLMENMELNVVLYVQKTPEGGFKATCSLTGRGEKSMNHLP